MPKKEPSLLTQAEYARSRKARGLSGGTKQAVNKAVDEGRITAFGPDKLIDPELADVQWARNTRVRAAVDAPAPGSAPAPTPAPGGDLVDRAAAADAGTAPIEPPAGAAPASLQADPTYQDARARQATADARTAELKLAELEGQLIRVDQVHAAFAGKLAPVREALLQVSARLAPRLAPLLASQSDLARVQTMLEAEIHQVLAPLSMSSAMHAPEGTGG